MGKATRLVCRTTWIAKETSNLHPKLGSHWQRDLSFWDTSGSFLLEASRICPVNTQGIRERVTGSTEKVLKRYFDVNGR